MDDTKIDLGGAYSVARFFSDLYILAAAVLGIVILVLALLSGGSLTPRNAGGAPSLRARTNQSGALGNG